MSATPMVSRICFRLTLPININSKDVAPVNKAFDRFAGIINAQIINTGVTTGINPF